MQIKDFVAQVRSEIKEIKKKHKKETRKKNLVYIENNRAVGELEKLLSRKSFSRGEADYKSLLAFAHCLSNRWDVIEDTDAVFANSLANELYDSLANACSQIVGSQKNKLLRYKLKIENADAVNLNRAAPSDDNETFIDVLECLRKAKYNGGALWHTNPHQNLKQDYLDFLPPEKDNIPLSNTEKDRVIHFNLAANKFYQSMMGNDKSKQGKKENSLIKSFGSKPIMASYGQAGQDRLALKLFHNAEELIKSVDDFTFAERADLLDRLSLETLNKFALNNSKDIENDLPNHIKKKSSYYGNPAHDQTMLMIYHAIYSQHLVRRTNEYSSFLGWASGQGIPKTIKIQVAKIISALLLEPLKLNELEMKAQNCINNDPNMSSSTKRLCLKALKNGTTGLLIKQAKTISDPKYFEPAPAPAPQKEAPKASRWW